MAIQDEIKAVEDKLNADIAAAKAESLSFWDKAKTVWYGWLAVGFIAGLAVSK
jgi:hypothetical protein